MTEPTMLTNALAAVRKRNGTEMFWCVDNEGVRVGVMSYTDADGNECSIGRVVTVWRGLTFAKAIEYVSTL